MPLEHFSNNFPLELYPIAFISNTIGEYMRVKLLLGKRLSQRIRNILISRHFLYDYIMLTNDLSNKVVLFEYVFGPLMRPWFLCFLNGSIVITIHRYGINNARYHSKFCDELPYPNHFLSCHRKQ